MLTKQTGAQIQKLSKLFAAIRTHTSPLFIQPIRPGKSSSVFVWWVEYASVTLTVKKINFPSIVTLLHVLTRSAVRINHHFTERARLLRVDV